MPEPKEVSEKGITVKKEDDMAEWYSQVCLKAELAEYSTVKGCMIIRPYGYAIWENIQKIFDRMIKEKGVKNAYFPLFIPEKFFKLEASHAEGFSPQVAWLDKSVTGEGDRLAIRPTSEAIMYDSYSRWIRSHRDLPLLINQWCNVVRWETEATKLFLRSREFLWQEGHCVYATAEELEKETLAYLNLYKKFAEEYLAVPVIAGRKTDKEKFAGAVATYSIEGFMPDGKALQCGTSHNLGQNFAKSFNIKFLGKDGKEHLAWQNSWGISTRLIGALVMSHSDNKGLILPPNIAPYQIVIVPILFENTKQKVLDECKKLKQQMKEFSVFLDDRDEYTPGWKFNEWEMKGVPLRIEIGPKDIEKSQAVVVRRDNGKKEFVKLADLQNKAKELLADIQDSLFKRAKNFLDESIVDARSWEEFEKGIKDRKLVRANFCGESECEEWIKSKTEGASSRNIPFDSKPVGKCVHCGKKAKYQIFFSKAY